MSFEKKFNEKNWRNLQKEFLQYFDDIKSFDLLDVREELVDFHYWILFNDENEYRLRIEHIKEKVATMNHFQHWFLK